MLESMKASVQGDNGALRVQSGLPHFLCLSDDPLVSEVVLYTLPEGTTLVGSARPEGDEPAIVLDGPGITEEMGRVTHRVEYDEEAKCLLEQVRIHPQAQDCFVNGAEITEETALHQGDVVQVCLFLLIV